MTKIDIISGFLGAGKTTLIKKLLAGPLKNHQVVLIENEFGEIGIDGGFLQDAGIEIREMNSGCICCSLVGDFGTALNEVIDTYNPERVIIEPSGVGKLSDVIIAVENAVDDAEVNCATAVVDVTKCKMHLKNFGEFYRNQIEAAGTIVFTRTDLAKATQEKVDEALALVKEINPEAMVITTPLADLDAEKLLAVMEDGHMYRAQVDAEEEAHALMHLHEDEDEDEHEHHHHHHHDDDDEDEHEHHHHHHHDDDDEDEHEHHHHHHDDDDEDEHEHEHHHHHDDDEDEHEHHHHHHDDEDEDEHEHHHHHHDDEDEHEHHHHDHHHHHHHHGHDADEIFDSWGMETAHKFTAEQLEGILDALNDAEVYGNVLRAKGIVQDTEGGWLFFDMVPEEREIRAGESEYTGKLCVIGAEIKTDKIKELFGV